MALRRHASIPADGDGGAESHLMERREGVERNIRSFC